jgi:hypothetical protein
VKSACSEDTLQGPILVLCHFFCFVFFDFVSSSFSVLSSLIFVFWFDLLRQTKQNQNNRKAKNTWNKRENKKRNPKTNMENKRANNKTKTKTITKTKTAKKQKQNLL